MCDFQTGFIKSSHTKLCMENALRYYWTMDQSCLDHWICIQKTAVRIGDSLPKEQLRKISFCCVKPEVWELCVTVTQHSLTWLKQQWRDMNGGDRQRQVMNIAFKRDSAETCEFLRDFFLAKGACSAETQGKAGELMPVEAAPASDAGWVRGWWINI